MFGSQLTFLEARAIPKPTRGFQEEGHAYPALSRKVESAMRTAREAATSTAMTPDTEPGVQAAIVSAEGQPDLEAAIRERAYAIWEEEGRPEGQHLQHWLCAESEIVSAAEMQES